ncbi:ABC transporter permease [Acidobacteria bacterium AH-259-O06]|nr:ABC transporter permease [Acidobacteria bacterium AH-259-O06]
MHLRELFYDTLRTLWAHKLRTALTMFGISWGIISIILMVAAGEGLRVGQRRAAETMGKDILIVFSGQTSMHAGGMRAGRRIRWQDSDYLSVQQQVSACQEVLPELGRSSTPVRSPYNTGSFLVTGSLPPFQEIRSLRLGEGRFYNWEDQEKARRVAFIGSEVRKQLFAEREVLGKAISVGGLPYTIIGVMKEKNQDSSYDGRDVSKVFIPFSAMIRDFPEKPPSTAHTIDRLLVTPKSFEEHEACKSQVRRALARLHNFDPRDEEAAPIWDTVENTKAFHRMTDGMKYFMGAIGVITLLLGGIGVMNIMLVSVRERTREIGVRKAVGASSRSILWQFFVETSIVVFLSGGLGLSIAYGICSGVNAALFSNVVEDSYFAGLLPTLDSGLLAFALLGTVAILSALYPASRAAAVDPIEALRYEAGG